MGLRILLVEDEVLLAILAEELLEDLGHMIAATAGRLPTALECARSCEADFALLDINLDGETSFEVAAALRSRGIPFAFATGYSDSMVPAEFAGVRTLRKPFSPAELAGVIDAVMGDRAV